MNNNELNSQDKTRCLSCENCKCQNDEYLKSMQIGDKDSILKRDGIECGIGVFYSSLANGMLHKHVWTIVKIDHFERENRVYKCIQDPDTFIKWKLTERYKWQD